jgi:hypothetical protein
MKNKILSSASCSEQPGINNGAPLFQNESYEHINRYEQRKKSSKKKKGLETRITLRVISRLNPINQLFFLFIILKKMVYFFNSNNDNLFKYYLQKKMYFYIP